MQGLNLTDSSPSRLIFQKACFIGIGHTSFQVWSSPSLPQNQKKHKRVSYGCNGRGKIKALALNQITSNKVKVKATITVQPTVDTEDLFSPTLFLELASASLDPKTGLEKKTITNYAHKTHLSTEVQYLAEFEVPNDFGEIGAILIENEHHREMFIQDVVLDGFLTGPVNFNCQSWIQPKSLDPVKRVFFANQSYLPSETPEGVKRLREEELQHLRGNGQDERQSHERIYDYDVYNDLGDPDQDCQLQRPVLGGSQHPYPRRCRTGRPRCHKDVLSEQRSSSSNYVPRDERFSEVKQVAYTGKKLYTLMHVIIPWLRSKFEDPENIEFPEFSAIDDLFDEGLRMPPLDDHELISKIVRFIKDNEGQVLRFEPPTPMAKDRFFWLRDEEFGRQTLAGLNPCCIQLVTEWPLKSKLDPSIYGPAESKITTELVEQALRGSHTVAEAIEQKRLFILDYHDLLLPLVEEVRKLEGTTLYGSRALFFLTNKNTLKPLAIELTRPPMDGKPQWKEVYTPSLHSTGFWLWRLAKLHVLAHDSGYHQLVSHWLRTHCATEPYIIAANRQLSAMHPIYRLLNPHFRYTMEINALSRQGLINAGGTIENCFTPGKHSILLSSIAYDKQWQFDLQALPNDLINRGLAIKDPNAPHGLRLTIEDYPYANDGLVLWDALKEWFTEYVNHYYPEPNMVESDTELQAWWEEIRTVGHGDKKDEPWWPVLKTNEDLIEIVTTIAWTASGHHAAVNFGQYAFAGYFPNRPTIARTNMPLEDRSKTNQEWKLFMEKPETTMLKCFPTLIQALTVLVVLEILSTHSPDEQYIGQMAEPAWMEDPKIKPAFEKFKGKLQLLEGLVGERNVDESRMNRHGAGMLPYEFLKPTSGPGVTGQGVPYSISI
ncbi:hypothetical protein RJT34_30131 [Clitoria ternatea]|uniref:Lipoxygenase n=1 Tax=Clitoria ternatea TaxID=43366 RepID=A0AAN9ES68_CLITE